ncbi:Phenol 2-monooxygenase [Sulfobacillus acidophilus TPY]|uniref:propane 2-monooxygenase n=1 Tax=Sulfobacillus acidophilus (strain ATCC 700253 / DSM 10332 / NAL) TaxID=679936 RepID=G8U0C9_SULAD|nr:Phenol 2-monooxygenase [Sulfobacillus acidophilus TPY]AEW06471.1 Phenol 2-monooxygenase [Sulfobacillus acidophilus DSM 10332]
MAYEIRQNVIDPIRVGFDWVQRRLGRPANRYEEASIEVQQEENFHYRPLWDPEHDIFDPSYSALQLSDWYQFTDPRQYYYFTYNQARTKSAEQLDSALQYADESGQFDDLDPRWRDLLFTVVGPLRHFEYGANMAYAQISRFSYGTTIEQAAIYCSFDHLGNAQQLTKVLLKLPESLQGLTEAKKAWMDAPALQPLRRYIEDVLVLSDWGEQWVALSVALAPYLYPLVFSRGEELGRQTGLGMVGMALRYFYQWYRDDRQWTERLMDVLLQDAHHDNRTIMTDFLTRWQPRAREVADSLAAPLAAVAGADAQALVASVETTDVQSLVGRLNETRGGSST